MKLKPALRSFSFRAGVVTFLAFCAVLLALRIVIYVQAVQSAREDIEAIVKAYESEIKVSVSQFDEKVTIEYVKALLEEAHDQHFVVALHEDEALPARPNQAIVAIKKNGLVVGNINEWPQAADQTKDWLGFEAPYYDNKTPARILASVTHFPQGFSLLVGYDMAKLEMLKDSLWVVLVENVIYAFIASLLLSIALIYLLNRHMRRLNHAFARVQSGKLDYRIPVAGTGDQFDRLSINFNETMDWLQSLLSTVRDSSNALAHDMRTPLSRLRLELSAISECSLSPKNTCNRVGEQVDRVDELITMFDNILNIAKAESRGSLELFEPVDLALLTRTIVEFYQPMTDEKHIHLALHLPDAPVIMKGDKQLLSQAIMNLVDNACKYSPKKGKITVSLNHTEDEIQLCVADNGEGIPAELIEKAKERFFRADPSRHTSGHGLGLSLVNAVAGLHHGALTLEDNNPGLKATLKFLRGQNV